MLDRLTAEGMQNANGSPGGYYPPQAAGGYMAYGAMGGTQFRPPTNIGGDGGGYQPQPLGSQNPNAGGVKCTRFSQLATASLSSPFPLFILTDFAGVGICPI